VVEGFDEVLDSLVIDTSDVRGGEGELLCFLVLADGASLPDLEPALRSALRRELAGCPPTTWLAEEFPSVQDAEPVDVAS
ncbi:MAG: acetoacetate--CoA ligase, partial [Actinomycetota bacterium]|nr:acetoacetate--CoA ligase [Actinomycetota bacterium]